MQLRLSITQNKVADNIDMEIVCDSRSLCVCVCVCVCE